MHSWVKLYLEFVLTELVMYVRCCDVHMVLITLGHAISLYIPLKINEYNMYFKKGYL